MAEIRDAENTILMELKNGTITIELLPDIAPGHCERMKELARSGQYDDVSFHRVIDGFMAQTGDPNGNGTGGSSLPDLDSEFSLITYERGTVGMARSSDPDSANSQFFITFGDYPSLDNQYTVFGKVIEGMDLVDKNKRGAKNKNGYFFTKFYPERYGRSC